MNKVIERKKCSINTLFDTNPRNIMNRKERRMNERKMKKSLKNDAALIEVAKQNKVYESDTYSPEMMKIASEIRQELARENPDAFLNLLKLVA